MTVVLALGLTLLVLLVSGASQAWSRARLSARAQETTLTEAAFVASSLNTALAGVLGGLGGIYWLFLP